MEKSKRRFRFVAWVYSCECGLKVGTTDSGEPVSMMKTDLSTLKHCEHHKCEAGIDMRFVDGLWNFTDESPDMHFASVEMTDNETRVVCSHCGSETVYPFKMGSLKSVYMQNCPECGQKFKPKKETCDE